jgi:hypothetical protein
MRSAVIFSSTSRQHYTGDDLPATRLREHQSCMNSVREETSSDTVWRIGYHDCGGHQCLHSSHIVTWRLKVWMVEPDETFLARQRLGKHVPAATNAKVTMDCYETVFSVGSTPRPHNEDPGHNRLRYWGCDTSSAGGFEYLHRSPMSCRGWRKGNPVPGGITGPHSSQGI